MKILIHQKSSNGAPPLHDAQRAELLLTKWEFLQPAFESKETIQRWYDDGFEHCEREDDEGEKYLVRTKREVKVEWFINVENLDELLLLARYFGPLALEETDYLEAPILVTLQEQ
jgi:hypothetical protein